MHESEKDPRTAEEKWSAVDNVIPKDPPTEYRPVFDPQKVKETTSTTLPPCIKCQSTKVIAVRRTDILYAVIKCIECLHLRQLSEAEYLQEWPGKACDVCRNKNADIELKTLFPHQRCDLCGYRQGY